MSEDKTEVLTDDLILNKFDQLLFKLESFLNFSGGIVIPAIILLSTLNVLGRWLFDFPVDGYVDWIEQAMAFIALLGIAYNQRLGGHIRMDMLIRKIRGSRWLWFCELVTTIFTLLIVIVLIYGSYLHFYRAFSIGDSSLDINLPIWPSKLVVPIALGLLALRLLLQVYAYFRVLTKNCKPIALPPIEEFEDMR